MAKTKAISCLIVLLLVISVAFMLYRFSQKRLNQKEQIKKKQTSNTNETYQHSPDSVLKLLRLSTDLIPINYHILVQPYMRDDQLVFDGTVLIELNCTRSTSVILLHAKGIKIDFYSVILLNSQNQSHSESFLSIDHMNDEILNIKLPNTTQLNAGSQYKLGMSYQGSLTSSSKGFYRSSYIDPVTQEIRFMAMTQLEPLNARSVFPCYDEPSFKATFDIEIIHWSNQTAISNMPIISTDIIDSDWTSTTFDRTVKMSTYLVALAVGDFVLKEQDKKSVPEFRVITKPSVLESANEAIKYGPQILSYYQNYFQIDYPLPKLDILAAPDFQDDAIDNWGLIIYGEKTVLYDKDFELIPQLYRIVYLLAREISHQWFGNLVTPVFWQDIWLNEGFATFILYQAIDAIKPNWKVNNQFVLNEYHNGLSLDSMINSHCIHTDIKYSTDIERIFDVIPSNKAASIIRMMSHMIGEEAFRKGLHNFLIEFEYGNAEPNDLWRHLQSVQHNTMNDVDVQQVMNSWTMQAGYPLITVIRDYVTNNVQFSQYRFLLNHNNNHSETSIQYEVPITYTTGIEQNWDPKTRVWLHRTTEGQSYHVTSINITNDDWLIVNLQEVGFYRVTYDQKNWNMLINQLVKDPTKIKLINRVQILNDLFNLAKNGVVEYELALKAILYLRKEKETLPFIAIESLIEHIDQMLRKAESYSKWKNFILNIIKSAYDEHEFKLIRNDDFQNSLMQESVARLACEYGLKRCLDSSRQLFGEFMFSKNSYSNNSQNNIPANVRSIVYCMGVRYGNDKEWDFIFDLYSKEQNAHERDSLLKGLNCTQNPTILQQLLNRMFNSDRIRIQDIELVFKRIAQQEHSKQIAFKFLTDNWKRIHTTLNTGKQYGNLIKLFEWMNTENELAILKKFISKSVTDGQYKNLLVLQTIEQIESNIIWMNRYKDKIDQFISPILKN